MWHLFCLYIFKPYIVRVVDSPLLLRDFEGPCHNDFVCTQYGMLYCTVHVLLLYHHSHGQCRTSSIVLWLQIWRDHCILRTNNCFVIISVRVIVNKRSTFATELLHHYYRGSGICISTCYRGVRYHFPEIRRY